MGDENEEKASFKDLGVCDQLVEACDNLGWKVPTKIQIEAIPHALEGQFSFLNSRCYFYFLLNLLLLLLLFF